MPTAATIQPSLEHYAEMHRELLESKLPGRKAECAHPAWEKNDCRCTRTGLTVVRSNTLAD
ncbi:MAG: hypothetical protein RLY57_604 [Candidatus Parcubacteria bacterium]|jgi:hypothetical protein